ncbi:microsomal glutathione S-transferase 1-like [Battus philenor]|uniref:microsomal glutathione S-transferase 1-like n=1 Tax=Battus philenor TaxID=42288 RepID=UPI0035D005DD
MAPLTLSSPEVQSFFVHSAILALKVLCVGVLTIINRMIRKVFSNPEDAKLFRGNVKYDDLNVERIRRAHLNDLENIPVFWVLGALYLTTGPISTLAIMLFRVYTVCRIIHTIVYAVIPMPQPTRAIAFAIPVLIKWYLGIQVVLYYITAV